jgi:ABC-type branched-subunit amino acid transport system permease subunit
VIATLRRRGAVLGWLAFLAWMLLLSASGDVTLINVAVLTAIWTTWGTSFNLIWGYAGQFSMAQVGFGALSAYVAAVLVAEQDWNAWAAAGAGIMAAVLASVIVGAASLRLTGFYFAIMTLAFSLLLLRFLGTLDLAGKTTGMSSSFDFGTLSIGSSTWDLGSRSGGFLWFMVVVAAVALLFVQRLGRTGVGRALRALRDDEVLAAAIGAHPLTYRLTAFALSAVLAGVGGICYASHLRYITPSFFALNLIIVMIVLVVVGGRGYVFGPFLGAAFYVTVTEWIRIGDELQAGLFGVVLIGVVLLAPRGILGTLDVKLPRPRASG